MSSKRSLQPLLIRCDRLSPTNYTLSLLQEGMRVGLIGSQEMNRLQVQLMSLLNERVLDYTRGGSSSVRTETAQNIMLSVLYCLDAYLKQLDNPLTGLTLLQSTPLTMLYERGVVEVASGLEQAKSIYADISSSKLDIPLLAYQGTIDEALPSSLRNYDPAYAAQETMAAIDYPLAIPVDDLKQTGVFYIQSYVERLKLENDFCNHFSEDDVEQLLTDYGQTYSLDYTEALINIFEIVVNNALFSVISGRHARDLLISETQHKVVTSILRASSQGELESLVNEAAASVLDDLSIQAAQTHEYLGLYARQVLLPRLADALRIGVLDKLVIMHRGGVQGLRAAHFAGVRMSDQDFRRLIKQIRECQNASGKLGLIAGNVRSVDDYVDVLRAGCLYGGEYQVLFASLSEWELAVLAKTAFAGDLREDRLEGIAGGRLNMDEWQTELLHFLQGLDQNRVRVIESSLEALGEITIVHADRTNLKE